MAPHSSALAWKIPWTEEPGGLLSMGSHRVGHDWSDLAVAASIVAICHLKQHRPRAPVLPRRWKHNQCWANLVKVRISWSIQWSSNLSIPSVALKLDKAPWRSLVLSLPTVICWDVWVLSWSLVIGLSVDWSFYFAGWTQKYYLWPCGVCGYVCNVWICICSNIWEYLILLQKKKWDNTI